MITTSLPEVPTSSFVGVPVRTPVLAVNVSQLGTVVPVMVSVSPSTSVAVTVYVYTASSVAVVIAVLLIVGASLALDTTMVNESVTLAVPSEAVITTAWFPTSEFVGVPVSAPELHVSHEGTVVQARVTVSPLSSSLAVVVYEYATSSLAPVTAVLVIVGASFTPVMVMVTVMVSDREPSETVIVYCSVTESPVSSPDVSESELSRVYVQTPLEVTANDP